MFTLSTVPLGLYVTLSDEKVNASSVAFVNGSSVTCVASKDIAFTVSENVRVSTPVLRLRSNVTKVGGTASAVNWEVSSGEVMGTTRFLFMSSTAAAVIVRRVLSIPTARSVSSLMAFRSGVESSIVRLGV